MRIILSAAVVITLSCTHADAWYMNTDHGWVNMGRDPNTIILEPPPPYRPSIQEQLDEQQQQLNDLEYQIHRITP